MRIRACAFASLLLAACGGAQPTPYTEPDVEGVCKVDPAAAPGRVAKPDGGIDCYDEVAFGLVRDACNDHQDPAACFQAATCLNLAQSTTNPDDVMYEAYQDSAQDGFSVACEAGIAEGCVIGASMAEERVKANPDHPRRAELLAHMCEGYQKGCHLGDEFDGCGRCIHAGCTGLDGAEPAPIR